MLTAQYWSIHKRYLVLILRLPATVTDKDDPEFLFHINQTAIACEEHAAKIPYLIHVHL